MTTALDVLDFWFSDHARNRWFERDPSFDVEIRDRFLPAMQAAAEGRLDDWRRTPEGALALIVLLDQFPRNVHRGTAQAFATDAKARAVARHAVDAGFDADWDEDHRLFCYLPFEHSEDIEDQKTAVALFRERSRNPRYVDYAERHHDIIERFGRFPHRNAILGRESTAEEAAFLLEPNSSF